MGDTLKILTGIIIPLAGTAAGAAAVFFIKGEMKPPLQKALLGFASGVMMAASFWSLLIPAIDMAKAQGGNGWLSASAGFLSGMGFLLFLDSVIPHLHAYTDKPEGAKSKLGKNIMLILAVTLHNIPEGMAIGVVFAGTRGSGAAISAAAAYALSVGIAIQNIPEGAIISAPLACGGVSKRRAFSYGVLSGAVEPIGAIITILMTPLIMPVLPYILAFAAGAMIYVIVEELIPESQSGVHSNIGTVGVAIGFTLMMILDAALG